MPLDVNLIEKQFALMNRSGPSVKFAVQQIKYECIRYAHELLREQGANGLKDIREQQVIEAKAELNRTLAYIHARKGTENGDAKKTQV